MDKETQLALGLNHGLPNWYRRAYAVNVQPTSPPEITAHPLATTQNRLEGPWRRLEAVQTSETFPPISSVQTGPCKWIQNLES